LIVMKKPTWWRPPRDTVSRSFARNGMPRTLFGFARRVSGANQAWAAVLACALFVLATAPLEMQRRILNAALLDRDTRLVLALALTYAGIVVAEGLIKLLMNVYAGWIGEKAARALRLAARGSRRVVPVHRTLARRRPATRAVVDLQRGVVFHHDRVPAALRVPAHGDHAGQAVRRCGRVPAYNYAIVGYLYPQSFMIVGQAGRLVYADALYLSMTVLTSTGFGDIARRSRGRRAASASSSRSPGRCSSRS
jgi:hypothetical protein